MFLVSLEFFLQFFKDSMNKTTSKELWRQKHGRFKSLDLVSGKRKLNGRRYKEWLKLKARRTNNAQGEEVTLGGDGDGSKARGRTGLQKLREGNSPSQALDGEAHGGVGRFVEYWVPVHLSDVQREQYCASLLSNSLSLCSYTKSDSAVSLNDILVSSRKCCDHPFLVDPSIRSLVIEGVPVDDQFDAEVESGGKLSLLDKFLSEIKSRGLRVIIVFQKLGASGLMSTGDILDDFLHEKHGTGSYARIDEDISRLNKQDAASMFNDKGGGAFVCLIENRACTARIKLSSVDVVILFDSDWDLFNDIRAVKRITTRQEFEQAKIFRLYSCCTVEEKVLILGKQGVVVDNNSGYVKETTCQKLLTWGAYHQFGKLTYYGDDFPAPHSNVPSEHTLAADVLRELSALLPSKGEVGNSISCSVVSKVQRRGGTYSGKMPLIGELKKQLKENLSGTCQSYEDESPGNFWRDLLKGRRPRWRHLRSPSRKITRKFQALTHFFEGSEQDNENRMRLHSPHKKRKHSGASRLLNHHISKSIPLEHHLREVEILEEHDTGVPRNNTAVMNSEEMPRLHNSRMAELSDTPSRDNPLPLHQGNGLAQPLDSSPQPRAGTPDLQPPTSLSAPEVSEPACLEPLQKEINRIRKEKEQAITLHEQTKLQFQSSCEKEMEEIQKKYDLLLQNAEMEFMKQKQDFEAFCDKVYRNKLFAGAMKLKHSTPSVESEGTQTVTIYQLSWTRCVHCTSRQPM